MIFNEIYSMLAYYLPPKANLIASALATFVLVLIVLIATPIILGWVDRKFSARIQSRYGPIYVGKFGLLQNFADVIKLMGKNFVTNQHVDRFSYNLIPVLSSVLSFLLIALLPFGAPSLTFISLPYSLLFIYILLAFSPLLIIIASWGENNKFAVLGGFRSAAQITTYELALIVTFISIGMVNGSYDIINVIASQSLIWNILYLPLTAIVFFIGSIAVIERAPFDLPESSQELQAGWRIEYSGLKYGLFMIGDYVKLLAVSILFASLFLGGWSGAFLPGIIWFWIKTVVVLMLLMSLRWSLGRPRIDQLLSIGWKWLLPLSVLNLIIVGMVMLI
ncbi:MAG: complex I subunit 1/NuoH family protein [Candidatus Acidifodinimicrobium sp.]